MTCVIFLNELVFVVTKRKPGRPPKTTTGQPQAQGDEGEEK